MAQDVKSEVIFPVVIEPRPVNMLDHDVKAEVIFPVVNAPSPVNRLDHDARIVVT